MRVRVCACAPHLANISKIVQDATRAGTQAPGRPPPQEHKRPPQEYRSRSTAGTQRTRIAKEIKNTIANKIFLTFLQCIFAIRNNNETRKGITIKKAKQ